MKIIDIDNIDYAHMHNINQIIESLNNSKQINFDDFSKEVIKLYNERYGLYGYPSSLVAQCCETIALQCGMKDFFGINDVCDRQ